jgi:RNA polymerase sigma-70 factor (ECF subfamily)
MNLNHLLHDNATELFHRFQEGDGEAFKVLYDRHFPRLCLIIGAYVEQREVVEDIVTNAFIKLYDHRAGIKEPGHIYAFLFVVAKNEAIGHLRLQRRQRKGRAMQEQLVDREYHDPRETELERDRWMAKIQNLVELLPPARKKIFRLHFFEGLSIREIANQLNLTETTVRNQRNRALIFLRQAFLL